jgi:alkanesulfonate monooxygenase SsuD/methylene tetrahydromethanopterin reductase-like flavin-dependent oxidoreductase (luciferase family)
VPMCASRGLGHWKGAVLRISVSLRSRYPADDARATARRLVERARAARAAGLAAMFVGDHHGVADGHYFQNTPVLGRLLAEWGDAPVGALYLLPLWHPVLVAEQVGTLAALAGGRFILQCAIGGGDEQFAALGVPVRTRPSRFEACLPIIRRLLAGEEVTADAPYHIERARIGLVPDEPVEVWVGGHAPAAIDRAARLGDGWLAGPDLVPERARALATSYLERCEAHGHAPTAVAIRRDIHVGADGDDAQAVAGPVLERGYRGMDPAACIIGGPGQVAAEFRALSEAGYTDVVIRHLADDHDQVLASFARLAEVVTRLAD